MRKLYPQTFFEATDKIMVLASSLQILTAKVTLSAYSTIYNSGGTAFMPMTEHKKIALLIDAENTAKKYIELRF